MFPELLSFPEIPKVTSDTDSHCRYQNLHIRLTIQKQKHKKRKRKYVRRFIEKYIDYCNKTNYVEVSITII